MKVSIDKTKCIMCGSCVAICPEVFEMKDDGSVDVKDQYKDVDIQDGVIVEKVKQAQSACPATAIVTEE
ncbi:MAG TPA: ferredoxin [Candidatus Dojkabacteria bacterium]|jgi:ferredoxin|nr:ferredoxin [Candidatus Dojkabacteria bacterium]